MRATARLTQQIPRAGGSEIRAVFQDLKKAGCWWKQASTSGHWKIYDGPAGRWVGTLGKGTGDPTSLRNFRAAMRNNGVDLRQAACPGPEVRRADR